MEKNLNTANHGMPFDSRLLGKNKFIFKNIKINKYIIQHAIRRDPQIRVFHQTW